MVTIVVIMLLALTGTLILGYEYYKKQSFIAKAIDGQDVTGNYITEDTKNVINMLKDPSKLRIESYMNAIRLPDQQRISYTTDTMEKFKIYSDLNFEPTPVEWQILRGVVRKMYQKN